MKELSFEEIGSVVVTMRAESGVERGHAVGMAGKERVSVQALNGQVCGVVLDLTEDGMASVQVKGFVTMSYSGSVTPGWVSLVANGSGGIQKAGAGVTGHECLLISSDPAARTAVVLL